MELKSTMKIPEIVYRTKQTSVVLTRPVLKQQYLTPTDMDLPKYTNKTIKSLHKGIPITNTSIVQNRNENVRSELDGFYLLESTGMGFPEDAQQAVLSDKKLLSVVADDFTFFTEMLYIDVSENFLSMEPFGAFPKLRELRMACNRISSFGEYGDGSLMGFDSLMYLDLSYNKLIPNSILSLDVLPQLRELDLCGNNLKTLPEDLSRFPHLERLLLDYNQMGDNAIFHSLATISSLRQLSLANNFLSVISWEACSEGLRLLESLDISFNYFSGEESVEAATQLPRLVTLCLYGNPLLGPTGEDPLFVYIEGLVERAGDFRDASGSSLKDIEFLTEIPRKRTLKKGQALGRQALYRDFSVVQVDTSISSRSTREWRMKGAETMFAEAMHAQKKPVYAPPTQTDYIPDLTFLTNAGAGDAESSNDADQNTDAIADDVMQRVAAEMGILNSAELMRMRDRAKLPLTASQLAAKGIDPSRVASFAGQGRQRDIIAPDFYELTALATDEGDEDEYGFEAQRLEDQLNADKVPRDMFNRQMGDPTASNAQPVALKTAMKALSLALKQPLTDYNEVPSKFSHNAREYVRPTASSKFRQMPRRAAPPSVAVEVEGDDDHAADKTINRYARKGLSEPLARRQVRQEQREYTLSQIDQVLDSLNDNTHQFTSGGGQHAANRAAQSEFSPDGADLLPNAAMAAGAAANAALTKDTMNAMRYFARPYHGIKSLMDMVDEVTDEFNR